jgi:hypothetical protein
MRSYVEQWMYIYEEEGFEDVGNDEEFNGLD